MPRILPRIARGWVTRGLAIIEWSGRLLPRTERYISAAEAGLDARARVEAYWTWPAIIACRLGEVLTMLVSSTSSPCSRSSRPRRRATSGSAGAPRGVVRHQMDGVGAAVGAPGRGARRGGRAARGWRRRGGRRGGGAARPRPRRSPARGRAAARASPGAARHAQCLRMVREPSDTRREVPFEWSVPARIRGLGHRCAGPSHCW